MKRYRCFLLTTAAAFFFSGAALGINLTMEERSGIDRVAEPVTFGVPLAKGWTSSTENLVLSVAGTPVPAEMRAACLWPDGSIRWLHLDFQTSLQANGKLSLSLDRGAPVQYVSRLKVEQTDTTVTVTTGKIRVEVRGPNFNLFNRVWLAGKDSSYSVAVVSSHNRGLALWAGGMEYLSSCDPDSKVEVESLGPMRVVLRSEGLLKSTSSISTIAFICRLYFFNDSPVVRLAYTFENRGPYQEGREDKVVMQGLHVELPTCLDRQSARFFIGRPGVDVQGELSDPGAEAWVSVPASSQYTFGGYANGNPGNAKAEKSDRLGWIALADSQSAVAMGLRYFWQMHPGSLEVSGDSLRLTAGLIPRRLGKNIDIYSGVARTHYLSFAFLDSVDSRLMCSAVASCQKPLVGVCTPEYYCRESRALGKLIERNESLYPEENRQAVHKVESEIGIGFDFMLEKVESRSKNNVTREGYGFLAWGDGMHYAWVSGVDDDLNVAWNSNYYDLPHMCCLEFVRTGDWRYWDFFLSRAHHLMDVHTTHFETGNALNGANRYCPPTDHVRIDPTNESDYHTANVYVSNSTNHHKTQGLFDRYYLTGDERSLEVALKALDFARSFGAYSDFGQPRGAAFQVNTLLEGYRFTGNDKYLQTATQTFELWWNYFANNSTKFSNGFFMVGFLMEAFIDYYETTGDQRVVDWADQALAWMRANRPTENYSNMALGIGFLAARKNDPSLIAVEKNYLASWQGIWSNAFKDFGLNGRSLAKALYYLSYEGLGQPVPLRGDINGDKTVDIFDLIRLLILGKNSPQDPLADFNGDGRYTIMDVIDLLTYLRQVRTSAFLSSARLASPLGLTVEDLAFIEGELKKVGLTEPERASIRQGLSSEKLLWVFSPPWVVSYTVPESPPVRVLFEILDPQGRLLVTLVDENQAAGTYRWSWDGMDREGQPVPSGVYFYRIQVGDSTLTRKLIVLR